MGLREINATRTRELLADTALTLFAERGYDSTTMEDVAHAADVGISTLYRYFPTKEQLGIAFLGEPDLMAKALDERPADEDPDVALGHAVRAFLETADRGSESARRVDELLDRNGRLRARLLEWLAETHELLSASLATRRGVPPDDVGAGASAWMTIYVLLRLRTAPDDDPRPAAEVADDVMRALAAEPVRTPLPRDDDGADA